MAGRYLSVTRRGSALVPFPLTHACTRIDVEQVGEEEGDNGWAQATAYAERDRLEPSNDQWGVDHAIGSSWLTALLPLSPSLLVGACR